MRAAWLLALVGCGFSGHGAVVDSGATADDDVPPMRDARGIDAAFDPAVDCPQDYALAVGSTKSHYRVIGGGHYPWEQFDDCANDHVGATHLASFENAMELDEVQGLIDAFGTLADGGAWVGGVQMRNQGNPRDGWYGMDGKPLVDSWHANEPDDGGGGEDGYEQFAAIAQGTKGLIDYPNGFLHGAVCECDGIPTHPSIVTLVDDNH